MSKPVRWLPRAEEDFRQDVAYLEERAGRKAVTDYLHTVAAVVERIADVDKILYQVIDEEKHIHRCRITPHKWLYYRVIEEAIELLTIFDSRQDPGKLQL